MKRLAPVFIAVLALAPRAGHGQSTERDFERWANAIAAAAERIAARAERLATSAVARIESQWNEAELRSRGRERWRSDRDLPLQSRRIDTTVSFSANGVVDLTSIYGNIQVSGWDRREVRIKAWTDRGRLEYDISNTRVIIEHRLDRSRGYSDDEMGYELMVPKGVRLVLRTTSGDIDVDAAGGEVEANSTSGDLDIEGSLTRAELGSVSGDITLRGVKGAVSASAVSGSIEAYDIDGDIKLSSTSGDVSVEDAKGRDVELSTTSGDVSYVGSVDPNGRYEFHSHSGTIDISLPATVSARLSIETFSGEIDSDFPITLQPGERTRSNPRRFDFTIGTGGPRILAESFSGDIEIRKR